MAIYEEKNDKNKHISVRVPSVLEVENNVALEKLYKSHFNSSPTDSNAKFESSTTEKSYSSNFSQVGEKPSVSTIYSVQESLTEESISRESISNSQHSTGFSNQDGENASGNLTSSYESSHLSQKQTIKYPVSGENSLNEDEMSDSHGTHMRNSMNDSESLQIPSKLHSTAMDLSTPKENSVPEQLQSLDGSSDLLVSGTIVSEHSLDSDEIEKDIVHDKASVSGSSISEIISVVENSKGKITFPLVINF